MAKSLRTSEFPMWHKERKVQRSKYLPTTFFFLLLSLNFSEIGGFDEGQSHFQINCKRINNPVVFN